MKSKPRLSFWQIWNLSFGFLGVQFGFALQNGNVSRILANLGADLHMLPLFWLAAPLMGLIIQPIVGGASDRTWNRLGRRLPYILGGAIVAVSAMLWMPNSAIVVSLMPPIIFGAVMLAIMDGSFNVTFQPFRALVADMLPEEQRTTGYSIQSFLINTGAVLGSVLPYVLTWLGVSNDAPKGQVADSVIWSFYIGGTALLITVLVTIFMTKEYNPAEFAEYNTKTAEETEEKKKESFLTLIKHAPKVMWQLSVVQLFSWFALYLMWVYSTPAIALHFWGSTDAASSGYSTAANWVGVLFGTYSLAAAIYSIFMPKFAKATSRKTVYATSLIAGGIGYISIFFFGGTVGGENSMMLFISMAGVGMAWAAILSMPYAILSSSLPQERMGVYMGIFNFTIAGPQILSGLLGGLIIKLVPDSNPIYILVIAGISMLLAAISLIFVDDKQKETTTYQNLNH
ncbi:MAG: MFS transporter [Bacteroidales bacterium]|nr:MFS transporter [Bacteroidales bacterium]